ncbi:sulfotransferase family cytosolic 1B member 1-like isoform X2, partial [Biomphalaria pfeifferi]
NPNVWRNPKDTLVSFYHHFTSMGSSFRFSDILKLSMANKLRLHTQFEYLQQMSKFEENHPDHPIIHLCYEEMRNVEVFPPIRTCQGQSSNDSFKSYLPYRFHTKIFFIFYYL